MLVENTLLSYKSLEGLSSHMVLAYVFELEDLSENSLISSFLNNTSSDIRSKMMWSTYKIYIENKDNSEKEQLHKRITYLWEYVIQYLKQKNNLKDDEIYPEIQWYGSLFPEMEVQQKNTDLLNQVLDLTKGNLGNSTNFIFDILKKYIELNPKSVLNVIEKLLKGHVSYWLFQKNVNEIIEIVKLVNEKYILQDFNKEVTRIEESLIDRGFYEFHEFIKSL